MKYLEKESSRLEFKKEIPKNEQIIKTIIGFCNQQGGKLIIARKDECGILEGPNEGQSSIDSSTMYYTIGNDGKLVLESSDSLKLVR